MLPFISAMRIRDEPAKESKSGSDDDNTNGGNEKLESQQSSSDSEEDSRTGEESESEESEQSEEIDEESVTEKKNYLDQREERAEDGGEEIKEKEVGDANVNTEQFKLTSKGDDDQNNGTKANKEECGGE